MFKSFLIITFVWAFTTAQVINQCTRNPGALPQTTVVEGCSSAPCALQNGRPLNIHVTFRAPRPLNNMITLATSYFNLGNAIIPMQINLGAAANTCNSLTNRRCPVAQGELVNFTLRLNITGVPLADIILNKALVEQKCALATCNKTHCKTPWHKPCKFAKYGLVEKLRPMLAIVGGMEFVFGIVLITLIWAYGYDYDVLYGTEDLRVITVACLNGSITLSITGCMLLVSIIWKIRRLILVHVFISTILGVYIFILSVFKMHYGLVIINNVSSEVGCRENENFFSSAACLMGLLTLLGSAVHFVGNVVVFTYYNLKYIQPCQHESNNTF